MMSHRKTTNFDIDRQIELSETTDDVKKDDDVVVIKKVVI